MAPKLSVSRHFISASTILVCAVIVTGFTNRNLEAQEEPSGKAMQTQSPVQTQEPVEIVILQVDNGAGEMVPLSTRMASWYLAKDLGLIVNLKVRGADPENYKSSEDRANLLANVLGIELPGMPELAGFGDAFTGHQYLVDADVEESVRNHVLRHHGEDCACVFDLAANTLMCGLLYSPDVDFEGGESQRGLNSLLLQNIKQATTGARFQSQEAAVQATIEFVNWMEELKPEGQEFGGVMTSMCASVEELLFMEIPDESASEMPPGESPAGVVQQTPEELEAKEVMTRFVMPGADYSGLTASLKPTQEVLEKLFQPEIAARAVKVYEKLFSDPQMVIAPEGKQEVIIRKITSDELNDGTGQAREFPGGYERIAGQWQPGHTIYEVNFVESGETSGLRFDGLVKVDGQWYLIPKVWRVIDEQPFGYEIE